MGGTMAGASVHLPLPLEGIGEWWTQVVLTLPANRRKDANSLIMIVLRSLWLERNARVIDAKATPSRVILRSILETKRIFYDYQCQGYRCQDPFVYS
jgi:hypothetical protein